MTKTQGRGHQFGSAAPQVVESREGAHRCGGDGPGAVTSAVAREAGIQASQLFRWRQQLRGLWLPGLHR